MHFLQAILISDISVLRVCNKTGGTIKGDIKKNVMVILSDDGRHRRPKHVEYKIMSAVYSNVIFPIMEIGVNVLYFVDRASLYNLVHKSN